MPPLLRASMFSQQILNGLALGGIYALVALGFTMVYGILFFINLPHGDVYMFGAYACLVLLWIHTPFWIALIVAVCLTALLGVFVEKVCYRPLRKARRLAPLLSALGIVLVLENAATLIFGANIRPFPSVFSRGAWVIHGVIINKPLIFIFITTPALMILLQILVYGTKIGLQMRAASQDSKTVQLMGVSLDWVISITFAIGSALACFAGVQVAMYYSATFPTMGFPVMLKSFAACVLGGIGNIYGAMLGGLIIGLVEVFTTSYISSGLRDAIAFAILVAVLLIRPTGILGGRTEEIV
jgi:branched-chain amino acid transport system permease protein